MKTILGTVVKFNACNAKIKYVVNFHNKKYDKRLKKFHYVIAHSDVSLKEGDNVVLNSCAPISKTKKYRVISKREVV
ncbi:30S ribosomal protein S17 [Alphaproteobacteria bacterium endosymbiont of Tiliacea citrago]|uniref:30S ribosomal protein S17 n=1 Tax=Alphaproteobacteria bacterium endosymbiont of Tiliacea citrago TaxID=3077944 RepID=UPI00313E063B